MASINLQSSMRCILLITLLLGSSTTCAQTLHFNEHSQVTKNYADFRRTPKLHYEHPDRSKPVKRPLNLFSSLHHALRGEDPSWNYDQSGRDWDF